jgi:hypothetical protein
MNYPIYTLPYPIWLDTYQAPSVLSCFLHTALFHRQLFQCVRPKEMSSAVFDTLVYVAIDDNELHSRVEEDISRVIEELGTEGGTVTLLFYSVKKGSGWFATEEKREIEKWVIPVRWYDGRDKSIALSKKEEQVYHRYQEWLALFLSTPIPHSPCIQTYLSFSISVMESRNRFHELFHTLISGPPKLF